MSQSAQYFIKARQTRAVVTNPDLIEIIDKALGVMAALIIAKGM